MLRASKIIVDDDVTNPNQVVNKSYVDGQHSIRDSIISSKADASYVDGQHSVRDSIIATKADVSYVDNGFIKNKVTIDDIPSNILFGTSFSFQDMANDLMFLENEIKGNPSIQEFIESYKNNNINLGHAFNKSNLILTNICRNFVNDTDRVCFDSNCFYKRVMILTSSGQPFVDTATYKDDTKGKSRNLDLDKDIIYLETVETQNIVSETIKTIYNPSNVDISNLSTVGVVRRKRYVAYTTPTNLSPNSDTNNTNNFVYNTLNIINPVPSNKSPLKYERAQDMSSTQEVLDAVKNGWGYVAKVNASYGYLPGYFIAYNSSLPITDDYGFIIRLSYQIY